MADLIGQRRCSPGPKAGIGHLPGDDGQTDAMAVCDKTDVGGQPPMQGGDRFVVARSDHRLRLRERRRLQILLPAGPPHGRHAPGQFRIDLVQSPAEKRD